MPKKPIRGKFPAPSDMPNGLWLAPKHNFKASLGEPGWDERAGGAPSHNRYLELADIALGHKKPVAKRKATPVHDVIKNDPYVLRQNKS